MEISEQIKNSLPGDLDFDTEHIECYRTFKIIALPGKSGIPSECRWLWGGQIIESYLIAIDDQIYTPDHQTIITDIKLSHNQLNMGSVAHWGNRLWAYCAIQFEEKHPLATTWTPSMFLSIFTREDRKIFHAIDKKLSWVQIVRGKP